MSETCDPGIRLEEVTALVARLGSRLPRVRDRAMGRWFAQVLHTALVHVAQSRGALDIAIGEGSRR